MTRIRGFGDETRRPGTPESASRKKTRALRETWGRLSARCRPSASPAQQCESTNPRLVTPREIFESHSDRRSKIGEKPDGAEEVKTHRHHEKQRRHLRLSSQNFRKKASFLEVEIISSEQRGESRNGAVRCRCNIVGLPIGNLEDISDSRTPDPWPGRSRGHERYPARHSDFFGIIASAPR